MYIDVSLYRARIGSFHGSCYKNSNILIHSSFYRNIFSRSTRIGSFDSYLYGRREWTATNKKFRFNINSNRANCLVYSSLALFIILSSILQISGDVHPNPGPQNWTDLSLCHANIRSIRAEGRMDHIRCELADRFDIFIEHLDFQKNLFDF